MNTEKQADYRSHVGCHFIDYLDIKHCSMQLLNCDNKAVATAEFAQFDPLSRVTLVRFRAAKHVQAIAEAWKDGLLRAPLSEMLLSSQPKTFSLQEVAEKTGVPIENLSSSPILKLIR